jgi:hypothetical protein
MNANEVLRGTISSTFEVFEPNDSGRATFDWIRGKKYVLFLFYSPLEKSWKLDGCGNSGLLTGNSPVRAEVEALRHAHGPGMIQGLASRQELDKPVAGVHIEAKGAAAVYRAVTSETVTFRIQVPPGDYSVAAIDNRWLFSKADISYENPQKVQIQSAGCVQLQLFNRERGNLHTEGSQHRKAVRLPFFKDRLDHSAVAREDLPDWSATRTLSAPAIPTSEPSRLKNGVIGNLPDSWLPAQASVSAESSTHSLEHSRVTLTSTSGPQRRVAIALFERVDSDSRKLSIL